MTNPRPARLTATDIHHATITDPDTGEVTHLGDISGMVSVPVRKPRIRRDAKFAMVDLDSIPQLEMSKGAWRLFWYVAGHMNRETSECRVTTSELAKLMGWKPANTSRALTVLCRRGILIRVRVGIWRINPLLLTRNAIADWHTEQALAPDVEWTE